nr:hypothetical protein Iba_chr10aCG16130 [Ipomoea batatas]GMD90288.1 hypothetical protein Iba_chr14dCG8230 [Ipomoea batatas]
MAERERSPGRSTTASPSSDRPRSTTVARRRFPPLRLPPTPAITPSQARGLPLPPQSQRRQHKPEIGGATAPVPRSTSQISIYPLWLAVAPSRTAGVAARSPLTTSRRHLQMAADTPSSLQIIMFCVMLGSLLEHNQFIYGGTSNGPQISAPKSGVKTMISTYSFRGSIELGAISVMILEKGC